MRQILEDLQPLRDDRVAGGAFYVGDKAQTAGIVLVGGVVHPLAELGQIVRALWRINRILVAGTFAAAESAPKGRKRLKSAEDFHTSEIVASRQLNGPLSSPLASLSDESTCAASELAL